MAKKILNVGLVGYGFMGRTHSNAFLQAGRYFDLAYQPVLKAVCARNAARAEALAEDPALAELDHLITRRAVLLQR